LIFEPACGDGAIVDALTSMGLQVISSDIATGDDFLQRAAAPPGVDCIWSNPPFALATEFIEHALQLMEPVGGMVVMLTRATFDSARGRRHLFKDHPAFCKKVVLLKRIVWFEPAIASPSVDHSWLIWDHQHVGPPQLAYADAEPSKGHRVSRPQSRQPSVRRHPTPSGRRDGPTLKRCA
jgi:hypothetical protein